MPDPIIPVPPGPRPLDAPSSTSSLTIAGAIVTAGTALGAYHGYKRDRSVGWAILWALAGGAVPIVAIPLMFAQGFARPASKK